MSTPRAILLPTLGRCKRGRRGGGSNDCRGGTRLWCWDRGGGLLRVDRSGPESAGMLSIAPYSPADQGHEHVRDSGTGALPKSCSGYVDLGPPRSTMQGGMSRLLAPMSPPPNYRRRI